MANNPIIGTLGWIRSLRRNAIIAALFLLIQGIFFIAKPETATEGIARFVAILIIIAAAISVASCFLSKDKTLVGTILMVLSSALVIVGIILFIRSDIMAMVLRYAIGIMIIVGGVTSVLEAVRLRNKRGWQTWVSVIVGILLAGVGIAVIISTAEVSALMKRIVGVILVVSALLQLWNAWQMTRTLKESEREA